MMRRLNNRKRMAAAKHRNTTNEDTTTTTQNNLDLSCSTNASSSSTQAAPTAAGNADEKKKHSRNSLMLIDQLVCPITRQLPVEPVMAEDGRVYERNAIEIYFKSKEEAGEEILSPYTHKIMGKTLTQATQHGNTIEILVDRGSITGAIATLWKEQEAAKERATGVVRELVLGRKNNVSLDDEIFAQYWYSKDLKGVNVPRVAALGAILLHRTYDGLDEDKQQENLVEGMSYILWANKRGSILSAYVLGMGYAEGKYGLNINMNKACYYLEKVVNQSEGSLYSLHPLDLPDGYYLDYLPIARDKLKYLKSNGPRRVKFVADEQFVVDGQPLGTYSKRQSCSTTHTPMVRPVLDGARSA